jgi:magnesium chelatase family protein
VPDCSRPSNTSFSQEHSLTLAHLGVLFLDELSLYRKDALEALRAPLEDGVVRIARSAGVIAFPCRFALVGAMNPCPCGYLGDARRACRCTRHQLELHRARLSGPLLDRIDIHVTMARLEQAELLGPPARIVTPVIHQSFGLGLVRL